MTDAAPMVYACLARQQGMPNGHYEARASEDARPGPYLSPSDHGRDDAIPIPNETPEWAGEVAF